MNHLNIPPVPFYNHSQPGVGVEVLKLKDLFKRSQHEWIVAPQQMEFFQVLVITQGKGEHNINFRPYPYSRGTVLTVGRHQIQYFDTDMQGDGFLVLFTEDFVYKFIEEQEVFKRLLLFNDAFYSPSLQLQEPDLKDVLTYIHHLKDDYRLLEHSGFQERILSGWLHGFLLKIEFLKYKNTEKSIDQPHLASFFRFLDLVEKRCNEYSNVIDYTRALGLSVRKLNGICTNLVGLSAKRYIDEVRIRKIKRMLSGTDLTAKEIAFRMGFDEPSNLFKYFRRITGQSPAEFRQISKNL